MARFIASGLLALLGLALGAYTLAWLQIGTLRQMGPGFFPLVLALVLLGLAVLIAISDSPAATSQSKQELLTLIATIVAILLFATGINRLGLLLSIWLSSMAFCLITRDLPLRQIVLTTAAVTASSGLLFSGLLRIQINLLP